MSKEDERELYKLCVRLRTAKDYALSRETTGELICLLLKNNPNVATKLKELAYEHENPHLGIRVRDEKRGPDMEGKNGESIEHKSACYTKTKGTCTIMFGFPRRHRGETVETRAKRIVDDMRLKTQNGGYVLITIVNYANELIREWKIDGEFMAQFLGHLDKLETRTNYGLNGRRCDNCSRFHKISHIRDMSDLFVAQRGVDKHFWKKCYLKINRNCDNN